MSACDLRSRSLTLVGNPEAKKKKKNNNNKLCEGTKISGNVISLIAPKGIHNYMTNAYNKAITLQQSHNPIWAKKKKNKKNKKKKPVEEEQEEEEEVLKKKKKPR